MLPVRVRLTLIYSALLFLAMVLSGSAVLGLLRQRLTARLDETLDRRLQGVENFLIRETTAATQDHIPMELAEYASTQVEGHWIQVKDATGRIILKSDSVPAHSRMRQREFQLYGQTYATRATASLIAIDESVQEMRFLLLWSSPLLLALISLFGYWISRSSLRPVDEMTLAARRFGAQDLSARLPVPPTNDEIARLAQAFNAMLARLEESFSRMQRFTADAAHELRTPLAALRTTAELSLRRSRENEDYRRDLGQVVVLSGRMHSLVDKLLELARVETPDSAGARDIIDIGQLIEELADELQPLLDARRLQLTIAMPSSTPPIQIEADASAIRRVLVIIIDNARKYTPEGGAIRIEMHPGSEQIEIRVSDNGLGIPPSDLPRIFDRFYRVDPSRDRQTGGLGLGLAIARQIARAHSGDLTAESTLGSGSTFRLTLPLLPHDPASNPAAITAPFPVRPRHPRHS